MSLSWFQKTQPNLKQVVLKKEKLKEKENEEKKTIKNHNQKALNKPFNATIILLQTKCIYYTPPRTPRISILKSQILKPTFLS